MKNKLLIISSVLVIFLCILIVNVNDFDKKKKTINYNGNNLLVTIDNKNMDNIPSSGNYYLIDYECDSINAVVTWDRTNYKLTVSNGKNGGSVSCSLNFKSTPLLSEMPVGSYVDYVGSGGFVGEEEVACKKDGESLDNVLNDSIEAANSCRGENVGEDVDKSGYTYGYCDNNEGRFLTTGWRIAYVKDSKVRIVSAGSPECLTRTSSYQNEAYIRNANAKALKYCNKDLVDGDCKCDSTISFECDTASSDAWALNDADFYFMTNAISGFGKRLTEDSSIMGVDGGTLGTDLFCHGNYSYLECGYNNDLLDIGGNYWFASRASLDSRGVYWSFRSRGIEIAEGEDAYGFRPVINLKQGIYVTGGSGTIDDPFKISNE